VEIQRIKQMLTVALDLCERNSGSSSERDEHGSQWWFNVLDRLINAKGLLRLAKELPHHAEVVSNVLSDLLQLTMQRMVSKVPLPDLLRKLTADHSGNRLGEFREMLMSMLKTYSSELDVCSCAMDVMQVDVKQMSRDKCQLKVRTSFQPCLIKRPLIIYLILPFLVSRFILAARNGSAFSLGTGTREGTPSPIFCTRSSYYIKSWFERRCYERCLKL